MTFTECRTSNDWLTGDCDTKKNGKPRENSLKNYRRNAVTTVYRVEHEDGSGPYMYKPYDQWMSHDHNNSYNHPGIWRDFADRDVDDLYSHVCGFSGIEQFVAWFNLVERRRLDSLGYKLCEYETKALTSSRTQAIFRKSEATLKNKIGLLLEVTPC